MLLKEIRITSSRRIPKDKLLPKYPRIGCVLNMFNSFIQGQVRDIDFKYIVIHFTEDKNKDGFIETPVKDFIDYYHCFDDDCIININDKFLQKKYILDTMYKIMLRLCEIYNWDNNPFHQVYAECLEYELRCEWYFKNKLFRSPNRQYYFGLYHMDDVDFYSIYEVLFDKKKQELARRLCFQTDRAPFYIQWASWQGQNDFFYYTFNGPQKVFEAKVADILEGIERVIPNTPSQFFK